MEPVVHYNIEELDVEEVIMEEIAEDILQTIHKWEEKYTEVFIHWMGEE